MPPHSRQDEARRPSLWLLTELPPEEPPTEFLDDLRRSDHLIVVEEHVAHGGLGQMMACALLESGRAPRRFVTRTAAGYVSGRYGSQKFHRRRAASTLPPWPRSRREANDMLMICETDQELTVEQKIKRLQGPILVLGASGFVGANLLRTLLAVPRRRLWHHHPHAGLAARGSARRATSGLWTC